MVDLIPPCQACRSSIIRQLVLYVPVNCFASLTLSNNYLDTWGRLLRYMNQLNSIEDIRVYGSISPWVSRRKIQARGKPENKTENARRPTNKIHASGMSRNENLMRITELVAHEGQG